MVVNVDMGFTLRMILTASAQENTHGRSPEEDEKDVKRSNTAMFGAPFLCVAASDLHVREDFP